MAPGGVARGPRQQLGRAQRRPRPHHRVGRAARLLVRGLGGGGITVRLRHPSEHEMDCGRRTTGKRVPSEPVGAVEVAQRQRSIGGRGRELAGHGAIGLDPPPQHARDLDRGHTPGLGRVDEPGVPGPARALGQPGAQGIAVQPVREPDRAGLVPLDQAAAFQLGQDRLLDHVLRHGRGEGSRHRQTRERSAGLGVERREASLDQVVEAGAGAAGLGEVPGAVALAQPSVDERRPHELAQPERVAFARDRERVDDAPEDGTMERAAQQVRDVVGVERTQRHREELRSRPGAGRPPRPGIVGADREHHDRFAGREDALERRGRLVVEKVRVVDEEQPAVDALVRACGGLAHLEGGGVAVDVLDRPAVPGELPPQLGDAGDLARVDARSQGGELVVAADERPRLARIRWRRGDPLLDADEVGEGGGQLVSGANTQAAVDVLDMAIHRARGEIEPFGDPHPRHARGRQHRDFAYPVGELGPRDGPEHRRACPLAPGRGRVRPARRPGGLARLAAHAGQSRPRFGRQQPCPQALESLGRPFDGVDVGAGDRLDMRDP